MVRRRRHQVVLTQRALGALCGVSQTMISRLETGKLRGINLHNLGRIVGALGGLDATAAIPRHLGPYRWLGQAL